MKATSASELPASVVRFLQTETLLRTIPPDPFKTLLSGVALREYRRGDVLYSSGDPADLCWLLVSGWVRVYRVTRDGAEKVLSYRTRGDLVAEEGLLGQSVHQNSVSVYDDMSAVVLHRAGARALLEACPDLLMEFLRLLTTQMLQLQQDLVDLSIADTRRRLVCTLLTLGERFGDVDEAGHCHLRVPMTQQELVCLVGAARETVSRICTSLGSVRMEQRNLTISNWVEFKALHG